MELITFIQLLNDGEVLEFKLNYKKKIYLLTNVAEHISETHKFRKPVKGTESDRFKIKYSGNMKTEDRDVAYYILIKEKESAKYLIAVDDFREKFIQI